MPLKKPIIALCSCNPLNYAVPAFPSLTSSLGRRPPHRDHRNYATVNHHHRHNGSHHGSSSSSSSSSPHNNDIPEWPESQYPTPYEIFAINKDAPYTKHRFYQLVKLYHPDKHRHHQHHPHAASSASSASLNHIPHKIRLERYRLVVAANDLLSDPTKRQLYDSYGIGWTGGRAQTLRESVREADRSWRHQPGSAAGNATWEDWERWHEARDGRAPPPEPLYMSNGLFATLVVVMCMIGAFAQMSRADQSGAEYMALRDEASNAIGQQLSRSTRAASGLSKGERVDTFLRDRENVAYQFVPSKYDRAPDDDEKS